MSDNKALKCQPRPNQYPVVYEIEQLATRVGGIPTGRFGSVKFDLGSTDKKAAVNLLENWISFSKTVGPQRHVLKRWQYTKGKIRGFMKFHKTSTITEPLVTKITNLMKRREAGRLIHSTASLYRVFTYKKLCPEGPLPKIYVSKSDLKAKIEDVPDFATLLILSGGYGKHGGLPPPTLPKPVTITMEDIQAIDQFLDYTGTKPGKNASKVLKRWHFTRTNIVKGMKGKNDVTFTNGRLSKIGHAGKIREASVLIQTVAAFAKRLQNWPKPPKADKPVPKVPQKRVFKTTLNRYESGKYVIQPSTKAGWPDGSYLKLDGKTLPIFSRMEPVTIYAENLKKGLNTVTIVSGKHTLVEAKIEVVEKPVALNVDSSVTIAGLGKVVVKEGAGGQKYLETTIAGKTYRTYSNGAVFELDKKGNETRYVGKTDEGLTTLVIAGGASIALLSVMALVLARKLGKSRREVADFKNAEAGRLDEVITQKNAELKDIKGKIVSASESLEAAKAQENQTPEMKQALEELKLQFEELKTRETETNKKLNDQSKRLATLRPPRRGPRRQGTPPGRRRQTAPMRPAPGSAPPVPPKKAGGPPPRKHSGPQQPVMGPTPRDNKATVADPAVDNELMRVLGQSAAVEKEKAGEVNTQVSAAQAGQLALAPEIIRAELVNRLPFLDHDNYESVRKQMVTNIRNVYQNSSDPVLEQVGNIYLLPDRFFAEEIKMAAKRLHKDEVIRSELAKDLGGRVERFKDESVLKAFADSINKVSKEARRR